MCIDTFFLYNETNSSKHPHSLCLKITASAEPTLKGEEYNNIAYELYTICLVYPIFRYHSI